MELYPWSTCTLTLSPVRSTLYVGLWVIERSFNWNASDKLQCFPLLCNRETGQWHIITFKHYKAPVSSSSSSSLSPSTKVHVMSKSSHRSLSHSSPISSNVQSDHNTIKYPNIQSQVLSSHYKYNVWHWIRTRTSNGKIRFCPWAESDLICYLVI